MRRSYIYVLRDPRTFRGRYVGHTWHLDQRFHKHLFKQGSTPKEQWIWSLRAMGFIPLLEVVDTCRPSEAHVYEAHYIKYFTSPDLPLLNKRAAFKKFGDEKILVRPRAELGNGQRVLPKGTWTLLKTTSVAMGGELVMYGAQAGVMNDWHLYVGEGPDYSPAPTWPGGGL